MTLFFPFLREITDDQIYDTHWKEAVITKKKKKNLKCKVIKHDANENTGIVWLLAWPFPKA